VLFGKGIVNTKATSPSLEWEGNQWLYVLFSPVIIVGTWVSSVGAQIKHNRSSDRSITLPLDPIDGEANRKYGY
jgi:hypothetical protein